MSCVRHFITQMPLWAQCNSWSLQDYTMIGLKGQSLIVCHYESTNSLLQASHRGSTIVYCKLGWNLRSENLLLYTPLKIQLLQFNWNYKSQRHWLLQLTFQLYFLHKQNGSRGVKSAAWKILNVWDKQSHFWHLFITGTFSDAEMSLMDDD